jgi:hypothetical protein
MKYINAKNKKLHKIRGFIQLEIKDIADHVGLMQLLKFFLTDSVLLQTEL